MAHETTFRDIQVSSNDIVVRRIHTRDLWQALRAGYQDFNAKPTYGLFLILIYPLFALLWTLFLLSDSLPYLAFPMIAGFTLLGPVISVALFELSRRRELGLEISWRNCFNFIHTASFAPIVALSLVMMALYVAWLFMAQFIYFGLFGADAPATLGSLWNELFDTRRGAALALHGTLVGFFFAFAALALSVVAFPLLLDKPTSSVTAMSVSIRAVAANLYVMALWGVVVVALLAVGAAIFLVGLAAVLPILGHATWHLYRRLVAH